MKYLDIRLLLPSYRDQRRVATVLDALAEYSDGLTARELQLVTGQSTRLLLLTLARLKEHGQIQRREIQNRDTTKPSRWLYTLVRRPQ